MNRQTRRAGLAFALALVAAPLSATGAQAQAIADAAAPTAAEALAPEAVETLAPEAVAALDRMGAALRRLERFSVVSDGVIEAVYANGQKLQAPVRTTYLVELPGHMAVDVLTDKSSTRMIYDGKAMTLVGLKARKYVRFPLAGTVAEVFDRAEDDYGVSLPLRELFLWGSPLSDAETPRSGFKVGEGMIGGVAVEHYAFRQSSMDWQIWLEKGDRPLPRKIVITRTDVAQQPQFSAAFTWDTAPALSADSFRWTPAADFTLIDFGTARLVDAAAPKASR